MTGRSRFQAAALVLALLGGGCAQTDPYQRTGMWQPSGAVQGNLAAMVADPRDLVRGHGDPTPAPHRANLAVDRLWLDRTKPFLSSQTASPNGTQGAQPGGAPAAGGS